MSKADGDFIYWTKGDQGGPARILRINPIKTREATGDAGHNDLHFHHAKKAPNARSWAAAKGAECKGMALAVFLQEPFWLKVER